MSRRILVTGGAGFIGSNFVRYLLAQRPSWSVVNLDALTYCGNPDNLDDLLGEARHTFVHGDINDAPLVRRLLDECDAVVHLAAESHVDRSIQDSAPFIRTNVTGTQVLLDAARDAWGTRAAGPETAPASTALETGPAWSGYGRFVYVSTEEVYGSLPLDLPEARFTEASPLAPNSPYAASKAAADVLVRAAHRTFGLDAVITRCCNNFGPRQFPEKIIPLFVTNLLEGRDVPLYGDGLNVRDWIHVEDHCAALLAVLERGRAGEVYNIGARNERSNIELTRALLEIVGAAEERIRYVPDRPGHDRRYAIDPSKIEGELGWRAVRSAWPQGLAETVRWYRGNERWWRRARSALGGKGL